MVWSNGVSGHRDRDRQSNGVVSVFRGGNGALRGCDLDGMDFGPPDPGTEDPHSKVQHVSGNDPFSLCVMLRSELLPDSVFILLYETACGNGKYEHANETGVK